MLNYIEKPNGSIQVRPDKKSVGTIDKNGSGWQYTPNGKKKGEGWGGEVLPSVNAVKRSLENPSDEE